MLHKLMLILSAVFLGTFVAHASKLIIPKDGLGVNKRGGKGVVLTYENAPDGSRAVKAEFLGDKFANVVFLPAELKKQCKSWPDKFSGLSGYFWGNGKYARMRIVFLTESGQFSTTIKLNHKGWKKIYIHSLLNRKNRSAVLVPNSIRLIFFTIYKKESREAGFGALTWEKPGQVLTKAEYGRVSTIRPCATAPVLDGNLDDPAWKALPATELKSCAGGRGNLPSRVTWMKTTYDKDNFYLAARCSFKKGVKLKATYKDHDSRSLYKEEDVEVFLYPGVDPRLYYQFILSPINTRSEAANIFNQIEDRVCWKRDWNGKWVSKTKIYDDHWDVEIAIPWKTIGASVPPEIAQFQFMRSDRTGKKTEHPLWSPVRSRPWHGFGLLQLLAEKQPLLNVNIQKLKRLDSGEIEIDGLVSGDAPLDKTKFKVFFSDPHQPTQAFEKTIDVKSKKGSFNFKIKPRALVNGFHQIVVLALSGAPGKPAGCNMFPFSQTILGNVAFEDPVLLPVPKECKWGKDKFTPLSTDFISIPSNASARTLKTAKYLAKKLYGLFGIRFEVKKGDNGRIKLSVNEKEVASKTIKSKEAYCLSVDSKGMTITGEGEAGLYYGVRTLLQLTSSPKFPEKTIHSVKIKDWPTFSNRIYHAFFSSMGKKVGKMTKGYELAQMKDMIERYLAGSKYNTMPITFSGTNVNLPSFPKLHSPSKFTAKDIRELADFAREHFVMPVPSITWGSHCPLAKCFTDLKDKDPRNRSHIDFAHPTKHEITKKLINDLVEAFGKPLKYFHTRNDELWKRMTKDDFMYKGKSRQDWFYEHLMQEHEIITAHGLRMVMFSDMIEPKHNGGGPLFLSKVADRLPRDIIISSWSVQPVEFAKKGFDTWREDNGFTADYRTVASSTKGFGTLGYNNVDTLFNFSDNNRWLFYSWHTSIQAANYAWNRNEKGSLPMPDWTMRYMPNLMGTYSRESNPEASGIFVPVSLESDQKLRKKYSLSGKKKVGNIPMTLGAVMVTPNKPLRLTLKKEQKLASVFVLDNVTRGDGEAIKRLKKLSRQAIPNGLIIGYYRMLYADGSQSERPVRLGRTISFVSGINARSRFIKEARAVYPIKPDFSQGLTQFEWINPKPAKTVKEIEIVSLNKDAPILFAGITLQKAKTK